MATLNPNGGTATALAEPPRVVPIPSAPPPTTRRSPSPPPPPGLGPALHIAWRFTTARKRALILSLAGVIFGVSFFICTQAQTQGFQQYFIKTILGTSGSVVLTDRFQSRFTSFKDMEGSKSNGQQRRKYYEGITDAGHIMRVSRQFSNVVAASAIVQGNVTARSDFQTEVVTIQGIDLDAHIHTTSLREQILSGSLDTYRTHPAGLMLGSLLAERLQVKVGTNVILTGAENEKKTFTVCAIFRSGNNIIDERRGYVTTRAAQSLLKKPYLTTSIVFRLRDPDRAPQLAEHFERLFGHRSRSWQEREAGNLAIFSTLRLSAGITVSLFIVVSGALIFNTLTMTVLDKIREIAILRSMGYRRWDISVIFLTQGMIVAALGSLLGMVFGAVLTWAISLIPVKVTGFFYTDHFLVAWSPWHYVHATLIAFGVVLIASYFPARRAANLAPVAILRGSGQ